MDESELTESLINREISWLEFNRRVLEQASDSRNPLFERLKFLGIFTTNLDEFIMKRLGGLKWQGLSNDVPLSSDGLTPEEQLIMIREMLIPLLERQADIFLDQIVPELRQNKIELVKFTDLSDQDKEWLHNYFRKKIFPVLTPIAVDGDQPFPFITNLSLSIGVALKAPENEELQFAYVKVSGKLPNLIQLPSDGCRGKRRYIAASETVRQYLSELFLGMTVCSSMLFRITRNAGLELHAEDESEDLLEFVEEGLKKRRSAQAVRMEHGTDYDPWIRNFVMKALKLGDNDVYELKAELDYSIFSVISDLRLQRLRYPVYQAVVPQVIANSSNIFSAIKQGNILVHHPYQSFAETVERFVQEAAEDEAVRSIKMTVYRVGDETPLLPLLIRAAENGKQVVCLVELMARFDEERNMQFAQALEDAGVSIVYGRPRLKIHAKTLLVVREEGDDLQCYVHIGTGNYNIKTSSIYTDLGFFTAESAYTQDAMELFNYLTGVSLKDDYQKLVISPFHMEKYFVDLIESEIANAKVGKPARIILKMNALEEPYIISKLYEASQAGVQIDLIVRGICCLRAGVPGLSENIRVRSIIGRFLEHSRVYYFANGSENPLEGKIFISSADWMTRNFHKRIEIAVPMEQLPEKERCWQFLQLMLSDDIQAWQMQNDGSYCRVSTQGTISTQEALMASGGK